MITIEKLKYLKESEDKVEFKKGSGGNISYDGGIKPKPSDRRRCILGYVIALCNENGGFLVIGMDDCYPHEVSGTKQNEGSIGNLESNIYRDTKIRPNIYELYEDDKRVLVIEVPSRPMGKLFKFEDVALMRIGEELKPMSDEKYLEIIQEQEPDFSEQICENLILSDLDLEAIDILKNKYSIKQNNPIFKTQSNIQVLSDLGLYKESKLTNAALILIGKKESIKRLLPQASIRLEYRSEENRISFDNRIEFSEPFFKLIENLWDTINLRNGSFPIQEGAYIFDVPYFNEEVIRESINNAITHRDYRKASEILIKQYPQRLDVINAGGFPLGVTIDNLLSTPSTPRNRLLADVLQKTGIVERSGQGVDKIFYNTLSEGKAEPDYSKSDNFQVNLKLSATIKDRAFALFLDSIQRDLADNKKLSVMEIITLSNIKNNVLDKGKIDKEIISKLLNKNLIEKRGKTNAQYYVLSKDYFEFTNEKSEYYKNLELHDTEVLNRIIIYLNQEETAKMIDFVNLFSDRLTRRQIRTRIDKFLQNDILLKQGSGKLSYYTLGQNYINQMSVITEAINIGMKEINKKERKK